MYEVISFKEKNKWDRTLEQFKTKDVYYLHGYCSIYELNGDGEPHLFLYADDDGGKICYPFIKRPLLLPFNTESLSDREYFDMITPYGYGGPIVQNCSKQSVIEFRNQFDDFCTKENIISEFIRFHPLLNNYQYLEGLLDEVVYDRETVFINLMNSEQEILGKYHKNHRRNINKAVKNKLEFRVFEKEGAISVIGEFYQLYKETMEKLNASAYYYFSTDYIKSLLTGLLNHSMLAAVLLDGKMIAAALCMYENGYLHYHLGCSDKKFLNLGSNIFLFHNIALWGKARGHHSFHLGGGHIGRDSLFEFKYRFNYEGTANFYVGKKVHNHSIYHLLVESWEKYYSQETTGSFFPEYRGKPLNSLLVSSC